jgi:hypothetical protein
MVANGIVDIEMDSGDSVMPWLLKEWSVLTWLPKTWLLLTWMFCDLAVIDRAANGLGGIETDGSYDHVKLVLTWLPMAWLVLAWLALTWLPMTWIELTIKSMAGIDLADGLAAIGIYAIDIADIDMAGFGWFPHDTTGMDIKQTE